MTDPTIDTPEAPDPEPDPDATLAGAEFTGDYPEQEGPDAIDTAAP